MAHKLTGFFWMLPDMNCRRTHIKWSRPLRSCFPLSCKQNKESVQKYQLHFVFYLPFSLLKRIFFIYSDIKILEIRYKNTAVKSTGKKVWKTQIKTQTILASHINLHFTCILHLPSHKEPTPYVKKKQTEKEQRRWAGWTGAASAVD